MTVLSFTVLQASLSSLLSLSLGLFVAWCLATSNKRLSLYFQGALVLPFLTPTLVGLLGYVTLFSESGPLKGWLPLYGLGGIVTAHTYFYTPYITLFLWQAWRQIPFEQFQLAEQLRLSPFKRFYYVEWPAVRPYFRTIAWLTFCMYLSSFTTVLVLGGGPQSTTLPVALYQSLFHLMDFGEARWYATLQIGSCLLAYLVMVFMPPSPPMPTQKKHPYGLTYWTSTGLSLVISFAFLAPLGWILWDSIAYLDSLLSPLVWDSLLKSLAISFTVGPLTTFLALLILLSHQRYVHQLSLLGSLFLITPFSLLGFLAFWVQLTWTWLPNFVCIVMLDIFLTLPFALHFLKEPSLNINKAYKKLSDSLGLGWKPYIQLVLYPLLRKPLGQSLGICSALAVADLMAFLMFSDYESPGLSALLYQQMGGYRSGEAMATALLLLIVCLSLIGMAHWIFKEKAYAQTQKY